MFALSVEVMRIIRTAVTIVSEKRPAGLDLERQTLDIRRQAWRCQTTAMIQAQSLRGYRERVTYLGGNPT